MRAEWQTLSLNLDEKLIIYNGSHIVVPHSAVKDVLTFLHSAHACYFRTKTLAQKIYFWPGMKGQVRQLTDSCRECLSLRPKKPKETMQASEANHPMEIVVVDLFSLADKDYLCMTDRLSWKLLGSQPEIHHQGCHHLSLIHI